MAFQPPQRQQAPRPLSFSAAAPPPVVTSQPSPQKQAPAEEEQEWILFSPDSALERTATDSTERTQTLGRSRLSDFGSLDTAAVSEKVEGEDDEENEDLDSLDDGLHAFNEPSVYSSPRRRIEQSGETVLPTHDGLGTFPGNSSPVQEQLWQHERYNPKRRRHSLRRSSLQKRFDALEEEGREGGAEEERFQRIENWRMEQSRAILEEIERETRRRRRKSRVNAARRSQSQLSTETLAPTAEVPRVVEAAPRSPENESFWERFTRRVIRDLMGIDDATLSFIFGEALPSDEQQKPSTPAPEPIHRPERTIPNDGVLSRATETWEDRLLARIARELGVLVHQLSEHPGAFSTYLRTQEPLPYAGLPTPPPSPLDTKATLAPPHIPSASSPQFTPTLPHQHQRRQSAATTDPSLWGIEEEDEDLHDSQNTNHDPHNAAEAARAFQREREYWEQDLDVKMVFGFLRNRLSRSPPASSPQRQPAPLPSQHSLMHSNIATATSATAPSTAHNPDSLRRAALIRHHHPLVRSASAAAAALMQSQSQRAPPSPVLGRRQSCGETSCASQSTKKSKTARSGSSRNYWDIGAGAGSVGSWGEV